MGALAGLDLLTISMTTPASAPTRTRLSSTRRRGSPSPTTYPNTRRASPAKTHPTIPDRPIAAIARDLRRGAWERARRMEPALFAYWAIHPIWTLTGGPPRCIRGAR